MAALGRARPGARLAPLCRGALGVGCAFSSEALRLPWLQGPVVAGVGGERGPSPASGDTSKPPQLRAGLTVPVSQLTALRSKFSLEPQ